MAEGRALSRYNELSSLRTDFIRRAQDCAELTIPSIFARDVESPTQASGAYKVPYQSKGAEGVNNIASKLALVLFPPNEPFFRFRVDSSQVPTEAADTELMSEVEVGLGKYERVVKNDMEEHNDRTKLHEALKHLVVTGNILLNDSNDGLKVYHLHRFVIRRDPMGNPCEYVVKESVYPDALPPGFLGQLTEQQKDAKGQPTPSTVDVYTHVERKAGKWSIYQECNGSVVPKSRGTYPLDACPWMAPRMIPMAGKDYGDPYVHAYMGDLITLEGLTQATNEGSAAAAKVLFLVNPNGLTMTEDLNEAENGAIVDGRVEDVGALQVQKQADMQVAAARMETISRNLDRVFMLDAAVTRDGERVTATEIERLGRAIDASLGGVYSALTHELQLPYLRQKVRRLERDKKLPALPKGVVRPEIVSGLDAIGRGNDADRLTAFAGAVAQLLGPQALQAFIEPGEFITRLAIARGIDPHGLIKNPKKIQEETESQQQQGQMQEMTPELIKSVGAPFAKAMASHMDASNMTQPQPAQPAGA